MKCRSRTVEVLATYIKKFKEISKKGGFFFFFLTYNEVDTNELLQGLKTATSEQTLANCTLEALEIACRANAHLIVVVGDNLVQLLDDGGVVRVEAAELSERLRGSLVLVTLDEVTRGFWQENEAADQDDGPSKSVASVVDFQGVFKEEITYCTAMGMR